MNNLLHLPTRFPKITLLVLVLLTALLGLGISKLEQRNSFSGELPASDPINVAIDEVKAHFGERSVVLIGLETDNIYTPATAQKIKDLSAAIADVPFVLEDEILSLATLQNVSSRDWGIETGGFLDELPETQTEWEQLRKDVTANEVVLDKLVSSNGRLAVIAAALDDEFEGGAVYAAVQALVAPYQGPERIHITGAPILVEDVQQGISGDSRKFIPIAILLIFVGFFLCFRTLPGVLLPVSMVIMSIIWTMGAMGYLGLPVTVVSNALPVIMVAVASSYGIHFMNAYYQVEGTFASSRERVQATLAKIGAPILITGLTSALGSASLLIFKITSLKEFGVIGAIGFTFATIICLTLLPALCSLLKQPKKRIKKDHWLPRKLTALTQWVTANRRLVAGVYLIALPFFFYMATQVMIGDDYTKFFPKKHDGRIAAEVFNDQLSGVRVMDIMLDASDYGSIKDEDFYSHWQNFQQYLEDQPHVGSVYSYLNVVDHIRNNMQPESAGQAMNSSEMAQFMMLHEMSAAPGEVFALRDEDYQRAKLQVFLTSSNPADHEVLYENIKKEAESFFPGTAVSPTFGGDVMHRIALGRYIVTGKVQNIILALLIVLLTCTLIFRSLRKSLLTLLPIVASLIMVFGCMGLIGIRLGISTSLLTAMIVGIGIDFAVHYLMSYFYYREKTDANMALQATSTRTGQAIAFDAASNMIGFSVLSFSGFLPVQHFGWLLAFSMLLIFLNTMVLYPVVCGQRARYSIPAITL